MLIVGLGGCGNTSTLAHAGRASFTMSNFSLPAFKARVDAALSTVRTILDNSKQVSYPSEVSHTYEDKYLLVEFLVNSAIAATFNSLFALGLREEGCERLFEWAKTRSVSLRWKSEDYLKVPINERTTKILF
jgi:hypothetical protein